MFPNGGSVTRDMLQITSRHISHFLMAQEIALGKGEFNKNDYGIHSLTDNSLAWGEMRLALAKFFWNFDVTLEPESENWYPHPMMVIWNSPKLNVKLHPVIR
jgi:hypothetical protein